ncbi:MAG: hypothetical protein GY841_10660 [FCB group bacterium]|nr:hypothetical protein [FCB group bacterium]
MSNSVTVLIDGVRFRYWTRIRMTFALDSMDTVELEAPFEPDDPAFREAFRPFTYKPLVVSVNDVVVFTGTMVAVNPGTSADSSTAVVMAYSKPGVLNDCTAPYSALPLEFKKQNLHQIADAVIAPFELTREAEAEPGPAFEKVRLKPTQTILSFLTELAKQRNQVIASTSTGAIIFRQSATATSPAAIFREGVSPLLRAAAAFNPQEYYSQITGLKPVKVRAIQSNHYTVNNTFLSDVIRPHMFETPDIKSADIKPVVLAKGSRMFANAASYTIDLDTWRTKDSKFLWSPNMTIRLYSPGAMVYNDYDFIVRRVELNQTSDAETASLQLALPGAYEGEPPDRLPWDE